MTCEKFRDTYQTTAGGTIRRGASVAESYRWGGHSCLPYRQQTRMSVLPVLPGWWGAHSCLRARGIRRASGAQPLRVVPRRGVRRTPEGAGSEVGWGGARAGLAAQNNASFSKRKPVRRGALLATVSQRIHRRMWRVLAFVCDTLSAPASHSMAQAVKRWGERLWR